MASSIGAWTPDVLPGFERADVAASTLVRPASQPAAPTAVVLHVHGYNDYFFHAHLAQAFLDSGRAFYAVDLAGAGRSLREGQTPHFMDDVATPGDQLAAAADAVGSLHPGVPLVVHAHSTGALTAAVWAADRPHPSLAALALNSPLLGTPSSPARRALGLGLPALAAVRPLAVVSRAPSVYAQHQHVRGGGRWEFDTDWKRPVGQPARAAWVAAAWRAQRRIAAGLGIAVPVLVARSDSSGPDTPANPLLDQQDTVLDVRVIERLAPSLGARVTQLAVPGGVHDLSLSREEPRMAYLRGMLAWLDSVSA